MYPPTPEVSSVTDAYPGVGAEDVVCR